MRGKSQICDLLISTAKKDKEEGMRDIRMRLFIAVNFNEPIKQTLTMVINELKCQTMKGNFTRRENLHLTLVFIGEVSEEKVGDIKAAMNRVKAGSFELNLKGIGKFKRRGGDIYWIGVEKDSMLMSINRQLTEQLNQLGFNIETREFAPHLTLGREVVVKETFNASALAENMPSLAMEVSKISLMKSERINGKLTYTEIFGKTL